MNIFLLIALYALQNSESAVLKQRSDYRDKWFNGEKNRLALFPTAEKESDPAVGDDHNNLVKDKHRNNWGDNIFQHYGYGEKSRLASSPTAEKESNPAIGDDHNNLIKEKHRNNWGDNTLQHYGYGEKNEATVENKRKEKNRAAFAPLIPLIPLLGILLYEFRLASSPTAQKAPAIGDDRNNLVFNYYGKKKSNAQRTSRQKRNLLTDLIQPHMDEMWDNDKTEEEAKEDREAYEWMLSVGWEKTIKPVLEKMIEDLRAERERTTDPEKIYIQDLALKVWNDVLEGGEPFIRWLLIEDQKLLRQKIESKDSQKQAQEQEHQVMKIGTSLYSKCLEECKKSLGTHEHCHTPCSKFANFYGRRQKTDETDVYPGGYSHFWLFPGQIRQKTDETDEDLKAALERLLEEYLRDEEGQLLRQKIESKDSQKQAQEQEHQIMKIGTSLYSKCLEKCKKSLGTHEHCHSPCSKFANSFGRRQKTDETDENLKEALERLLEEYLREEEGQS